MSFSTFNLAASLLRAISEKNYRVPTPIQVAAIPAILEGKDVWACAETGSGKTAAYALPILQRLSRPRTAGERTVRALIIAPTRELTAQIGESLRSYARYLPTPVKVLTVFGGVSINPQLMAFRGGADILVATPGRLLDVVEHNAVTLDDVEILVLDEADRLFDLNFADDLERILNLLSVRRQNLLFSATFPPAVRALADELLHEPVRIDTADAAPDISERVIHVDAPRRAQLLRRLIEEHQWERALVFVATKYATEHVAEKLRRTGVNAAAMHGELSQGTRTKALADFKSGKVRVIVATDLASRGIDVLQLPAVVNYDLPRSTDDYVHRIGRTGRAGAAGVAVSFVDAASEAQFRLIEKRRGMRLPRERIPGFEPTQTPIQPLKPETTGGVKGKRKSKKDKQREAGGST
ncbi:MAG: DEAD/DEAH box helicase [Steroidobacteraceae bacterium]